MKTLKKLLRAVLLVAFVFCLIGWVLPKSTHVERAIAIERPPEAVFEMLNSYRRFNEWSPWYARDPSADYRFEGPAAGAGASMRWVSQHADVGSGRQTILESEAPRRVVMRLEFDGQGDAVATFTLTPQGQGTRVVWGFDADHGMNPLARWFGLLFDRMIGPDFEQGLAKLKTVMEAAPR